MNLQRTYRLASVWVWLLTLLRAIDLGLALGGSDSLLQDLPATLLACAELAVHVAVLAGLRGRRSWGWGLAATWYPAWIAIMSVRLYVDYNAVLALLWTPFLLLTAAAHAVFLRTEVAEAFGVRGRAWLSLGNWLPRVVQPGAIVLLLSYVFGFQVALCLWTTAAIAGVTASRVYRAG